MSANCELLDEVQYLWVNYKKVGVVWAQKLKERRLIKTLEGDEIAEAGEMLCKGIAGELWPQAEEKLLSKYKKTSTTNGEWDKYIPKPDLPGVFAARVNHDFSVETEYGAMSGKKGDYLLKNFADRHTEYPVDLW
eukprot:CAMPEP_0174252838 /NCGR_PEP_ID=MMETSP0439-20130205/2206_1 /TAXON_ID=0 /ORGANISM="Stereomyxa ramosa, Strain Chinc5" /LENGTH=134 /DNA_ID=CAMNT_0015333487 /DNA_START=65 /DNA_END=466 /DNA_ORIENTATION=-